MTGSSPGGARLHPGRPPGHHGPGRPLVRRGGAVIAVVVLLVLLDLIVVGMVLAGGRDHHLTWRRIETVQAFYAAEAGMNMAIREMMAGSDEDGDGTAGTISDDADDGNDPAFGAATVRVESETVGDVVTLTSVGSASGATRTVEATLQ